MKGKKMILDFHTHLFPRQIRDHRERFFDGEPAFQLLYASPKSRLAGVEELLRTMDEDGVSVSVIFGFPWKRLDTARRHNDYIMDAVARHPDRFVGFCCLDPVSDPSGREVRRCLDGGLSGAGELAFYDTDLDHNCLESLDATMAECREKGLPVLIHANEPVGHVYAGKTKATLSQIESLVKRYPENKIVLAHWGGGIFFFSLMKKQVKETLQNVWFDTAASPFLYEPGIYRVAMDIIGPEKILFGSDFPLLRPKRGLQEMETAGVRPKERALIQGGNAAGLLKLHR